MKLRRWLDQRLASVAMFSFRLRQLTAVFGVRNTHSLAELLKADDREPPYANVYGLHNLRWVAFDAAECGGVASIEGSAQLLVFSMVCDGNVEDVLAELMRVARPRFCEIFATCFGFEDGTDPARFLEQHRVTCGYFFRDLGPLLKDDDRAEPVADTTLAEIEEASRTQARFERFYAEHGFSDPGTLREAYSRAFADDALPLPLAPWERAKSDEASATRRIADAMRKTQDRVARASNSGKIRRGIHAKSHGLLGADFQVRESALKVGLFAEQATYRAVLRPSNGSSEVRHDRKWDASGLALRVFVPRSASAAQQPARFITMPPGEEQGCQDFVLINHPVFFSPDVQRFALLLQAAQVSGLADKLLGFVPQALQSGGVKQLWHFARTLTKKLTHPLGAVFHSGVPYQLGPDYVAKYSIEPTDPCRFCEVASAVDNDGLSSVLKASLRLDPLRLKFFVHTLPTSRAPAGFESLTDVVEDATLDWDALGAEKHYVADVTIRAQQDPTTAENLHLAESIRFNPWHALVAHRPLGSLNRARWAAYRASQQHRSGILAAAATLESDRLAAE